MLVYEIVLVFGLDKFFLNSGMVVFGFYIDDLIFKLEFRLEFLIFLGLINEEYIFIFIVFIDWVFVEFSFCY